MAEITAQLVKQLREITDAGMMDCKKALVETDGDLDAAIEHLRQKGLSKAAKKAENAATEGSVSVQVAQDLKSATIIEVNSQTDFVAQNDMFKALLQKTGSLALSNAVSTTEELHKCTIDGTTFEEYLQGQIAKIGENIVVRRLATLKADNNGVVNGYVHSNGRVGVLIAANCGNAETAQKAGEFIRSLCMHAAAMKPVYLSYTELDPAFIEKEVTAIQADIEKENEENKRLGKPLKRMPQFVSRAQLTDEVLANARKEMEAELKAQGKPEQIWERIIPGQIERFIADNTQLDQQFTLLSQFYVMDDKKTIAQVIEEKSKELGGKIELVSYVRFELGEGLEKKACNFADEVAAQLQ